MFRVNRAVTSRFALRHSQCIYPRVNSLRLANYGNKSDAMTPGQVEISQLAHPIADSILSVPVLNNGWEYVLNSSVFWPSNIIERFLEAGHFYSGLPWWVTIIGYTILLRASLLPATILQIKSATFANNLKPEVQKMQEEMNRLKSQGQIEKAREKMKLLAVFMSSKGINPMRIMGLSILPIPFFMSTFFAIQHMSSQPIQSFINGGALWFDNLCAADPFYVLPLFSSLAMMGSLELSSRAMPNSNSSPGMKIAMRAMVGLSTIITSFMSSGLVIYFLSSNIISCIIFGALGTRPVRRYLGIPRAIMVPQYSGAQRIGFMDQFKEAYQSQLKTNNQILDLRTLKAQKPKV